MIKSIWRGEKPYIHVFIAFILVTTIAPGAVLVGTFFSLCAIECSALPWLTLYIGGAINILLFLPSMIWLAVGTWRSSNHLKPPLNIIGKIAIPGSYFLLPGLSFPVVQFAFSQLNKH
jgi:hypothetical protein